MLLPVTLTFAAACALLNLWLGVRIGRIRIGQKISHGDGGNPLLARRIRAQINFVENTVFVLLLVALIELAVGQNVALWLTALTYVVLRVLHGFGMDKEGPNRMRQIGVIGTMLVTLGLVVAALWIAYTNLGG